ncbi:hypothetical protein M407DRAFT_243240, partial [Tulasnella calospora MUT 4182]
MRRKVSRRKTFCRRPGFPERGTSSGPTVPAGPNYYGFSVARLNVRSCHIQGERDHDKRYLISFVPLFDPSRFKIDALMVPNTTVYHQWLMTLTTAKCCT